jgi:hypothetical protein
MAAHWTARPRFIFRGPGWVTSRGADPAPNVSVHVPRQLTSIAHSARPHGLDPGEEAHNARAAFELAATYDPIVIRQLGNNSARPDLALARAWYQRAREWGSPDGAKQLDALASAER